MTRTIQQTIEYCKERKAFGQPIINYQVIHYTLAELQTEVEALRSLIYRAAGKYKEACFLFNNASLITSNVFPQSHLNMQLLRFFIDYGILPCVGLKSFLSTHLAKNLYCTTFVSDISVILLSV